MIKLKTQHGIYEFYFRYNTAKLTLIHQFLPTDTFRLKVTIEGETYTLRIGDQINLEYVPPKTEAEVLDQLYWCGFKRITEDAE